MNKSVLDIYLKTKSTFTLFVKGISQAVTWVFRSRDTIRINVSRWILGYNARSTIRAGRTRISAIYRYFSGGQPIVKIRSPRIVINMIKITMKVTQAFNVGIRIRPMVTTRIKMTETPIKLGVRLVANLIVATLYTLGRYDPMTLGTVDTQTLGNMDYPI